MSDKETIDDIVNEIAEDMFSEAEEMAYEGGIGTEFKRTTTVADFVNDARELVGRIIAAHNRHSA